MSPWAQTSAYAAALREGRNPVALTLTARGDPSGRGRGFEYIREDQRRPRDEAPAAGLKARDDGTITGACEECVE